MRVDIRVTEGAIAPTKAHPTDAGWDLYTLENTNVVADTVRELRTGVHMSVEPGFYYRIVARSSTMDRFGLHVLEGIIDAGYTGELLIRVTPRNKNAYVPAGTRLAQAIFGMVLHPTFYNVDKMPETLRGSAGFGSSGG